MTDSPSPSGRSKTARSWAFGLVRPVLFAVGVVGLALGGLVLTHRSNPEIAALPPPPRPPAPATEPAPVPLPVTLPDPAAIVLVDSDPAPPIGPSDFRALSSDLSGFSLKPREPPSEAEPPVSGR